MRKRSNENRVSIQHNDWFSGLSKVFFLSLVLPPLLGVGAFYRVASPVSSSICNSSSSWVVTADLLEVGKALSARARCRYIILVLYWEGWQDHPPHSNIS